MSAAESKQRIVTDAWLVIATGGWWKTTDLAQELGVPSVSLHAPLNYMTDRQYVARRLIPDDQRETEAGKRGPKPRMEYAVRPDCMVPKGMTAQQVSDALVKGIAA